MNFNQYQKLTAKTAVYTRIFKKLKIPGIFYALLGLAGETGEVFEKFKKIARDKKLKISDEDREEFKKELGDILWYVSQIALELKISLDEIARSNIKKLFSRKKRGKLHGSGDNR